MSAPVETLKPTSMNALMSGLEEPTFTESISWIPNAPGWYLILAIIAGYSFYRSYLAIRQYQHNAYRRSALLELEKLSQQPEGLNRLPQLLRKTALNAYPRNQVSPLIGSDWELWLDKQCQDCHFATELTGVLATLSYAPNASLNDQQVHQLMNQTAHWIKHHEVHNG